MHLPRHPVREVEETAEHRQRQPEQPAGDHVRDLLEGVRRVRGAVPAQDDQWDADGDERGADERDHALNRHAVPARANGRQRRAQARDPACLCLAFRDVRHGFSNGHCSAATDDVAAVAILSKLRGFWFGGIGVGALGAVVALVGLIAVH